MDSFPNLYFAERIGETNEKRLLGAAAANGRFPPILHEQVVLRLLEELRRRRATDQEATLSPWFS